MGLFAAILMIALAITACADEEESFSAPIHGDVMFVPMYEIVDATDVDEKGTYYVGVFETSDMMFSTKLYTCGYYNVSADNMNSSTEPSGIAVTDSKDYDLTRMMVMKMMGGS